MTDSLFCVTLCNHVILFLFQPTIKADYTNRLSDIKTSSLLLGHDVLLFSLTDLSTLDLFMISKGNKNFCRLNGPIAYTAFIWFYLYCLYLVLKDC